MAYGATKRVGKKSMAAKAASKAKTGGKAMMKASPKAKGMGLTKKQKSLPPALQKKIMKSKKK